MGSLVLVSGGVRSGKSAFAESLMEKRFGNLPWIYWATGKALDPEMEERVRRHRNARKEGTVTLERGFRDLLGSGRLDGDLSGTPILLDNLGFCVMDLLGSLTEDGETFGEWTDRFSRAIENRKSSLLVVTDEVGQGGVALSPLGREFADRIGEWNQSLARQAAEVYAVMLGCPLRLR